jgi:O-6-methylguanine DNA methyltransferase
MFAYYPGPFGWWQIGCRDGAVTSLKCVKEPAEESCPSPLSDEVYAQLQAYLTGERRELDVPCRPEGTPFQRAVWEALCRIPYGETSTYARLARELGRPGAARAVGAAVGRNPIWIAIPCHRCIGSDGSLTGYAGGLEMKRALLEREGAAK